MISLGEMIAYLPIPGGHIKLAERFVDPALGFALGWNYLMKYFFVTVCYAHRSEFYLN